MPSTENLRKTLWASRDWSGCLRELAAQLEAQPLTTQVVEPAVVLGRAFEAIEPDRSYAVRMYFLAWNARPVTGALLGRAISLCLELGDLERAAKLARLGYQQSGDPKAALLEGVAWLDANQPAEAVRPLIAAQELMPGDESLALLVTTAKQEWDDPRPHVRGLMAQAEAATGATAASRYLCAARILRSCGFEGDDYGVLLQKAFRADPSDDSVFGLLENWLVGRDDRDSLAGMYRVRSEASTSAIELCNEYRRAGTKLVTRELLRGLGLRLLERSVLHGYDNGVSKIPGHIASLSLFRDYVTGAGLDAKLLEVLSRGLECAMPEFDRLWMAATGLEFASKLASDDTARAYAAIVAEISPEHPLLQDYCVDAGLAEGRWAVDQDQSVRLDTWSMSGQHGVQTSWQGHDKVGLAAATPPPAAPVQPAALPPRAAAQPAAPPPPAAAPPAAQPPPAAPSLPAAVPPATPSPPAPLQPAAPLRPAAVPPPPPAPAQPSAPLPAEEGEHSAPLLRFSHEPQDAAPAAAPPAQREQPPATELAADDAEPLLDLDLDLDLGFDLDLEPDPETGPGVAAASEPPAAPVVEPKPAVKPISIIPSSAMAALSQHRGGSLQVTPPTPSNPTARAPRTVVPADVRIVSASGDGTALTAITRDLSTTGLFLVTDAELTIGATLSVELALPDGDEFEVLMVTLEALVVRRADNGYGAEFVDPPADVVARIGALA